MTDGNEVELRVWSVEIFGRLVSSFKALTGAGCSQEKVIEILGPMIEYANDIEKELPNAERS